MSSASDSQEEVLAALERTFDRGAARITFAYEFSFDFDFDAAQSRSPRSGPLWRRGWRGLGRQTVRLLLWAMMSSTRRWMRKIGPQRAVGILDLAGHRCMYRYRGKSDITVVVEDKEWVGAPGTAVAALTATTASAIQPVWLIDLVRGITEAQAKGEEVLDGHTCRRFAARADLNKAAEQVPYQMALPQGVDQLAKLTRIPVEVWMDSEGVVRRIRHFHSRPHQTRPDTSTLELRQFGAQLPSDWSRLHNVEAGQPSSAEGPQ